MPARPADTRHLGSWRGETNDTDHWRVASCFSLLSEEVCKLTTYSGGRASPPGNRCILFAASMLQNSIATPKSVFPQDAEYLSTREMSNGPAEIAEAADVSGTVKPKALEHWSTDELQTAIYSGMLDNVQSYEAERILRGRELAPDRKLARLIYNNAAWTLAFSLGTFIVALGIFWLIATGYRLP